MECAADCNTVDPGMDTHRAGSIASIKGLARVLYSARNLGNICVNDALAWQGTLEMSEESMLQRPVVYDVS